MLRNKLSRSSDEYKIQALTNEMPIVVVSLIAVVFVSLSTPAFTQDSCKNAGLRDSILLLRVNESVVRATKFLLRTQNPNGSWPTASRHLEVQRLSPLGQTALCATSLLKAGEEPQSECIQKAEGYIFSSKITTTFEISMTMGFISAKYFMNSNGIRKRGDITSKDADRLSHLLKELLQIRIAIETPLNEENQTCWGISASSTKGDILNTYFALLGIRAASLHGLPIDSKVFSGSAHFISLFQEKSGQSIPRLKQGFTRDGIPYFSVQHSRHDQARGWIIRKGTETSTQPNDTSYLHTTASLAAILICIEQLNLSLCLENDKKLIQSVRDGYAWLGLHAGSLFKKDSRLTDWRLISYINIGLAGAIAGKLYLRKTDWYREGVGLLLAKQDSRGHWMSDSGKSDVFLTSIAVLFSSNSNPVNKHIATIISSK
jgi:hypothetical protein